MNYGLYLSASGVLTNMYRQDVYANNLANVKTVGFQHDLATIRQRDPQAIENPLSGDSGQELLDCLGGGCLAGPQSISFARGVMEHTGGALDVALETPETFLNVAVTDKTTGRQSVRLTRDGRLARDGEGYLVTVAGGHRVLDDADQPIELVDGREVSIDSSGRLFVDGQETGRLGIKKVSNTGLLTKRGQNLYGWEGADPRIEAPDASVKQGFVEASTVDPVTTLMDLINATKAVSSNANLIRYHDTLMDRAVNTLGRVA